VVSGSVYSFTPTASDPRGAALTFAIANKPAWAAFSTTTGQLSGTPASTDVGTFASITISVSDGTSTVSLAPFTVVVTTAPRPAAGATLSAQYPGDVGIDGDPSVVWHETFEEGNVTAVTARYDSYDNTAGMALVADHPGNSSGTHAMQLTAGGSTPATDLYKSFGQGYAELYFRYYAKYAGAGPWHHSGLWIGGYNPPLAYPDPHAGLKPAGNDRFAIGLEPMSSTPNALMDFYAYWMQMHSWKAAPTGATGDYYGNSMIQSNEFHLVSDAWGCYELHLKLNPDPAVGTGAILEVWQDDLLVQRFDDSGPYGFWVADQYCPNTADDSACTSYRPASPTLVLLDQQWRSTNALQINYFWPQNYNTDTTNSSLLLDDMVVATKRIGCTVKS
jgi:hypothetical protein